MVWWGRFCWVYFAVLFNYCMILLIFKCLFIWYGTFTFFLHSFFIVLLILQTLWKFLLWRISLIWSLISVLKLKVNILYPIMGDFLTNLYVCKQVTSLSGGGDTNRSSSRGMYLSSLNFRSNCCFYRELH